MEQTRRDIEAETRRAIQEIRSEVADLTVLATEKVTRKTLDRGRPAAARRGGARPSSTSRPWPRGAALAPWRRSPPVYARSLFEVAKEQDKLDDVREQLGAVRRRARRRPRPAGLLLLAVLLHRGEEGRAWTRRSTGADETIVNFLELLIEKHRMPAIFRIRARATTRCGRRRTSSCPVHDHLGRRARRGHRQADRRPDRRADRPQGRAVGHASTPTSSAASSSASATRSSTPPSATASNNFASRSPSAT